MAAVLCHMATEDRHDERRYRTAENDNMTVIYDRENGNAWVASTHTVELPGP